MGQGANKKERKGVQRDQKMTMLLKARAWGVSKVLQKKVNQLLSK